MIWRIFLLILVHNGAAAGEIDTSWIRGVYTGKSPRPIVTTETQAWQRATSLASTSDDAFVLVGSGDSMQPLYQPGTILVMQQLPFDLLQSGQTVLYRNKANKVVAHVLVTKARDGWRAVGLNNNTHDREPVVADNLVGIVIGAYQPVSGERHQQVASNARVSSGQ